MSLYLGLNLITLSVPLLLSFEKNLLFYKKWPYLFSAIFLVMIPFLVWDYYFTTKGHWGFNSNYLIGFKLFSLPIEEILFFIMIPYASLFGYYAIRFHFPQFRVNGMPGNWLTLLLFVFAVIVALRFSYRVYTVVNFSFFALVLVLGFFIAREQLFSFYAVFPILLIPFFLVNGILTGTGISEEIVWYSKDVIMGIRLFTIPVEDIFYAFSLLMAVLLTKEWLEKSVGKVK